MPGLDCTNHLNVPGLKLLTGNLKAGYWLDMKSFIDLVRRRQSTRNFIPNTIDRDIIESCLEAARLAPSASNSQPWFFWIVDKRGKITDLASKAFSGIYSVNSFAKNASVLIVVLTEKSKFIARTAQRIQRVKYNLIDIGIACDHLTLQAEDLGLKTCWIGWFNERAVKRKLKLSGNSKVALIIALGYAADKKVKQKVRKPIGKIRKYLE